MTIEPIASEHPAEHPASSTAPGEPGIWYIEVRPGRPGLGTVRRHLAEQGIRRVEAVTDRVVRCWADRAPLLPAEWGGVVARGEAARDGAGADPLPPTPGSLVRVQAGPAAGWIGRVQAVEGDQVAVEILVWGKGMTVRVPVARTLRVGVLPWERGEADAGRR